jgi:general secretion pathway protein K
LNSDVRLRKGAALLAVLWLTAALSAIAFSVANTVRGEIERSSTDSDGLKAYYLACGAIDRMLLYIEKGSAFPGPGGKPIFDDNTRVLSLAFPTGFVLGEFIPESSKLNVNTAQPRDLTNLLLALGVDPARAGLITAAIVDWRRPAPGESFTQFDQHYLSLTPSFRARHASLQEIEELLMVEGVTPDLFYGSYTRDEQGRLVPHAGLRDCLSVYGTDALLDVNTVEPAVMMAVGISPSAAAAIVALRQVTPIRNLGQLAAFRDGSPGFRRLGISRGTLATLRATAQLRLANGQLSDVRRSVSALVKFLTPESPLYQAGAPPYHILRWYDNAVTLQ